MSRLQMLLLLAAVGFLAAFVILIFRISMKDRARERALIGERPEENEAAFLAQCSDTDRGTALAVLHLIQQQMLSKRVPLRHSDNLYTFLKIDDEDLFDATSALIKRITSNDVSREYARRFGDVKTVGDLVAYVSRAAHQG